MGPISSPQDLEFSLARLEQLKQVINDLQNPMYGPQPAPGYGYMQKAQTRTMLANPAGGKNSARIPSMYYGPEDYVRNIQRQLTSALTEEQIARAAAILNSPAEVGPQELDALLQSRATRAAPPRAKSPLMQLTSRVAPLLTLLDLLTQTQDLNSNESAELQKRRGPDFSNKEQYEKQLQEVLQRNVALPPNGM